MSDLPALELLGISKRFGHVVALEDAGIVVRRGTVHALLGENGAGKTTLMRIAYGMLRADTGRTRVDGADVRLDRPADAIRSGIGMVHQHPANVPAMTVAENLDLGGRGQYGPAASRKAAADLAARVGFTIDPSARVADLSVAAQQRLEILKAIGRNARTLILDEPTAVLAPSEARDLLQWLRRFVHDGGTAIVITHKLAEARLYSDELTVLRGGRTVATGTSADATDQSLTESMIGTTLAPSTPRTVGRDRAGEVVVSATDLHLVTDRDTTAIGRATFDVRRGEVVGVVGVEGSGHHELLLALAGRHPVASGRLMVPERTSFVPEDRHRDAVVLDFTLGENVAMHGAGGRRGLIGWGDVRSRAETLLRKFDVRTRGVNEPMSALSGGNQQKVVLAREMGAEPQLLIVENPTRGLDIRASAFVRSQIEAGRDAGMAVVFYSSDLDEVIAVADRILAVYAGSVKWVEPDRARVGAAMLGVA